MEKKLYCKLVETPHAIFEINLIDQGDKLLLRMYRKAVEGTGISVVTFIPLQKDIAESVLKSIGDGFYDAAKKVK
jgi:hypothetical protein